FAGSAASEALHYATISRPADICECTREMRTIKIVDQSVLPIGHESCPLLCDLFSRLIVCADQFHIPDPLSSLSKVIQRDLLSIFGKCFVPQTAIPPACAARDNEQNPSGQYSRQSNAKAQRTAATPA